MQIIFNLKKWLVLLTICVLSFSSAAYSMSKLTFASDVFFEKNQTRINQSYQEKVADVSKKASRGDVEVIIAAGFAAKNEKNPLQLSQQRALAVKQYLMKLGYAPQIIFTEGKGYFEYPGQQALSDQKNARVELEWVGTRGSGFLPSYFKFSNSLSWFLEPRNNDGLSEEALALNATHPLAIARQIDDLEMREKFLHQLVLTSIYKSSEEKVAVLAPSLLNCSRGKTNINEANQELPNPYLFALVFGTISMQSHLMHCKPSEPPSRKNLLKLMIGKFCSMGAGANADVEQIAQKISWGNQVIQMGDISPYDFHSCAYVKNSPFIKWSVSQGADIDLKNERGNTAIQVVISNAYTDSVELLLQLGANAKQVMPESGSTLLHLLDSGRHCGLMSPCYSIRPETKKALWQILIQAGADPNVPDDKGKLPIQP